MYIYTCIWNRLVKVEPKLLFKFGFNSNKLLQTNSNCLTFCVFNTICPYKSSVYPMAYVQSFILKIQKRNFQQRLFTLIIKLVKLTDIYFIILGNCKSIDLFWVISKSIFQKLNQVLKFAKYFFYLFTILSFTDIICCYLYKVTVFLGNKLG